MKGKELRKWRKTQYLSQVAFAELVNVTVNTVANWENDRTRIPPHIDLGLEYIADQRERLVRAMNRRKAELAAQREMKMAKQHPAHYLKLLENMRKARAVVQANRDARKAAGL